MAVRSGNPTLSKNTFQSYRERTEVRSPADTMTLNGTVHRTFFLLCLVVASASTVWGLVLSNPQLASIFMGVGAIGGLIFALITIFKKEWSPITAPVYAVFEGLAIGAISVIFEARFPGIVLQAVGLTFGTLFSLLAAYRSGLIKATENFKLGVVAATGGIFVVYLVSFVMSLMGIAVPMLHSNGTGGIIFSLFVVVIAALNLVLDFDFIEQGVEYGAPKFMEWYGAFGLVVTLVWLYLEILRLLAKMRSRD